MLHLRNMDSYKILSKRQVFKCATNGESRKFNINFNKINKKLYFNIT